MSEHFDSAVRTMMGPVHTPGGSFSFEALDLPRKPPVASIMMIRSVNASVRVKSSRES